MKFHFIFKVCIVSIFFVSLLHCNQNPEVIITVISNGQVVKNTSFHLTVTCFLPNQSLGVKQEHDFITGNEGKFNFPIKHKNHIGCLLALAQLPIYEESYTQANRVVKILPGQRSYNIDYEMSFLLRLKVLRDESKNLLKVSWAPVEGASYYEVRMKRMEEDTDGRLQKITLKDAIVTGTPEVYYLPSQKKLSKNWNYGVYQKQSEFTSTSDLNLEEANECLKQKNVFTYSVHVTAYRGEVKDQSDYQLLATSIINFEPIVIIDDYGNSRQPCPLP